jgi:hypothetical protein
MRNPGHNGPGLRDDEDVGAIVLECVAHML